MKTSATCGVRCEFKKPYLYIFKDTHNIKMIIMNRIVLMVLCICSIVHGSSGQATNAKDEKLKAAIIALDIDAWNNWKNKDVKAFQAGTIDEFVSISSDGISTKEEMITTAFVDCNVKSFSLHDIEFVKLNKRQFY